MQQKYVGEIQQVFGDGVKAWVPELERRDWSGDDREACHIMYGDF